MKQTRLHNGFLLLMTSISTVAFIGCATNTQPNNTANLQTQTEQNTQTQTKQDENIPSLQEVMDRVVSSQNLDNALNYEASITNLTEDSIVLLCTSESSKYEAYGIISPEYGMNGILLNYRINGENNYNYLEESFSYGNANLQEQGENNVIFTFTQENDIVRKLNFETFDTGTMSLKEE
ncbi:MAG: hypothetical protein HFI81_10805 [Eubacterium sp.]|jgi:hypothetical protein|nr:hypothetical protein [Eubacterium sp.]